MYNSWASVRANGGSGAERGFCARNFLSPAGMNMLEGMRGQLLSELLNRGLIASLRAASVNAADAGLVRFVLVRMSSSASAAATTLHTVLPVTAKHNAVMMSASAPDCKVTALGLHVQGCGFYPRWGRLLPRSRGNGQQARFTTVVTANNEKARWLAARFMPVSTLCCVITLLSMLSEHQHVWTYHNLLHTSHYLRDHAMTLQRLCPNRCASMPAR